MQSNVTYEYKPQVVSGAIVAQDDYDNLVIRKSFTGNSLYVDSVRETGNVYIAKDRLEEFISALRAVSVGRAIE
jgi:hypothetical protein